MQGRKARTFCFRKTSFVHSRSGTYYALLPGYSSLKFLPDIVRCVYWVLADIWDPNSSHRICNKFFIRHCQARKEGSFVSETVDFFPRWILIRLTWNLSCFVPNSVETLTWNFRKKLFRENFSEILMKTKAILYRNLWNFALLSAIVFLVRIALKKIHISTFICCLLPL